MALHTAVDNEIKRRYESCVSPDVKKEYSIETLSDVLGEEIFIKALLGNKRIKKCKCCGLPFITNGRGNECYCNRPYGKERTCKSAGPGISRNSDPITREMDRARRLHLWRRSRNGKTDIANDKYGRWLSFAQDMERLCRDGQLSLDELRELIGADYRRDTTGK